MKQIYLVDIISTAVRTVEVEAENENEAIELVEEMDIMLTTDNILKGYDYEIQ